MLKFLVLKGFALTLSSTRSLLLAALLGPASYGVFGTLIIIQQFLGYAALGVREGVLVTLLQKSHVNTDLSCVHSSAILWGAGVGATVALTFLVLYIFGILNLNYLLVGVIAMLSILNDILININRAVEQLRKIALLELLYNLPPIIILLLMWKSVNVTVALMALVGGLFLSVGWYLLTLNLWRHWHPNRVTVRRLLTIGLPLALLSGLILLVNSSYVLLANYMLDQTAIGKVVFAANVCALGMFALNTVAWANTNRSMRTFYVAGNSERELVFAGRLRQAFRVSIIILVLVILAGSWVLPVVLPAYVGADEFILYFCLAQSYSVILFDEINYLSVSNRSWQLVAVYTLLLLAMLAPALLVPAVAFETLIKFGIAAYCVLGLILTQHCRVLGGTQRVDGRAKFVFVLFPLVVVVLYTLVGPVAVMLACVVFAVIPVAALFKGFFSRNYA